MIGQGQNDNEHTWALDGQTLVITCRDGTLQNRFLYDETTDRFVSSDDPEASAVKRGYKGQYIYRSTTE
jgi:GH18 family chitinase